MKKSRNWAKIGGYQRKAMKLALIERDGTKCFHCGRLTKSAANSADTRDDILTIDHWPVPKCDLPLEEWLDPSRAVIACQGCNRSRNEMSQVTAQAGEAGTAETPQSDSVHEHAVPQGCAQTAPKGAI